MTIQATLKAVWRKLPLSAARKARLRTWLARHGWLPGTLAHVTPTAEPDHPTVAWQRQWLLPPPRGTSIGRRDWIIFGILGWNFRIQRPQHLARELARSGDAVFYIEPDFVPSQEPGFSLRQIDPDLPLFAVKLHLTEAPAIYFQGAGPAQLAQLRQSMAALLARRGILACTAVVQHPYWSPLADTLPNALWVYDCMDHHEGFGGMPDDLLALEHAFMARADAVVVTSDWLRDWAIGQGRTEVEVVRNGCDYAHFHAPVGAPYRPADGRRVIGYFGAIAEWFDVELVLKLARRFTDCEIVLIGGDTVQAGKRLSVLPNVRLLGERPYAELPHHLHGFDVCLLPFQRIPLTLATNPVKVYEYLCAGREVVCIDLPEIAQFGDLVRRADSHEAFLDAVGQALAQPADAARRAERQAFAQRQTWVVRAEQLRQVVQERAARLPSVSIVVLTYNNWAYTQACLGSLFARTDYPGPWEVVVADNASSDETVPRLREWAAREPRMKLVLNASNLGFAAGNNTGLAAASGDYLVMLNNDTVVTRGWLLTLLRHFQRDPELGLLGPATNHIGNESKVDVFYTELADMPSAARAWTLPRMGRLYPMDTLAFFCVMLSRQVFQRVGPMDETFGRGFFEDDDYCRRIAELGLRMGCADDALVHHRLSASFDKVDNGERKALFERNKAYYESKWGPWQPHGYRPAPGLALQPSAGSPGHSS